MRDLGLSPTLSGISNGTRTWTALYRLFSMVVPNSLCHFFPFFSKYNIIAIHVKKDRVGAAGGGGGAGVVVPRSKNKT